MIRHPTLDQVSIMLLVTVTVGWLVRLAVEFLDDHWTERAIITAAVLPAASPPRGATTSSRGRFEPYRRSGPLMPRNWKVF
jgi:hypothetical protein